MEKCGRQDRDQELCSIKMSVKRKTNGQRQLQGACAGVVTNECGNLESKEASL